jgi:hypothetical protein
VRLAALLAAALTVAACQDQAPLPELAEPLALLDRATLDGIPLDVAALSGKVVVVNFWSPG